MESIEYRVKKIVSDHLGQPLEAVTSEAHLLDDLEADSLDTVGLVMACEEHFGIEISDDEAEKVSTVADLVKVVTDLTAETAH